MTGLIFFCGECGRRHFLPQQHLERHDLLVLCGACGAAIDPRLAPVPSTDRDLEGVPGHSVLVAHGSPAVSAAVGNAIREAALEARYVQSGAQALAAFDDILPDTPCALVLDVGIRDLLSFEVIASLRSRPPTAALPIVLLASVFDPTRYKRRPSSLHGASAYLELHHVPDRLPTLLAELLEGAALPHRHRGHMPGERARADALRVDCALVGEDGARAVARRIISDVALYHEPEIKRGIREGGLDEMLETILLEGRAMYEDAIRGLTGIVGDPFAEATMELVEAIRRREGGGDRGRRKKT